MIYYETDRLILRNVCPEDLPIMWEYRNSEACIRYQRGQSRDRTQIAELIGRRGEDQVSDRTPFMVAVALKDSNAMVGEIVVLPNEQTFTLGYSFHPAHYRQGYAYEALSYMLQLLHRSYSDWEFISFTDPCNEPSMALLKKLRYQDLGYLPAKDSRVFGKWLKPQTIAELQQVTAKTLYDRIVESTPIEKGWSSDRKYRVSTGDAQPYLLRIAPPERTERLWLSYTAMQKAASLEIPMCQPVEYGHCPEGTYALHSWIDGQDAESRIPALSLRQQYGYGLDAGRILRKIHTLPAPQNARPWAERFGAKIDRKLLAYAACPLQYDNGHLLVQYLEENRHLLTDRPQTFQHGDYHIGNMMLDQQGRLVVIDFDKVDHGDPWEEFNRIVWSAQASGYFATGMVDGYFDGPVPMEFWRLLAVYICSNTLGSLPWAIPFGAGEIAVMHRQAAQVLQWYQNMTQIVPTWYQKP